MRLSDHGHVVVIEGLLDCKFLGGIGDFWGVVIEVHQVKHRVLHDEAVFGRLEVDLVVWRTSLILMSRLVS